MEMKVKDEVVKEYAEKIIAGQAEVSKATKKLNKIKKEAGDNGIHLPSLMFVLKLKKGDIGSAINFLQHTESYSNIFGVTKEQLELFEEEKPQTQEEIAEAVEG